MSTTTDRFGIWCKATKQTAHECWFGQSGPDGPKLFATQQEADAAARHMNSTWGFKDRYVGRKYEPTK